MHKLRHLTSLKEGCLHFDGWMSWDLKLSLHRDKLSPGQSTLRDSSPELNGSRAKHDTLCRLTFWQDLKGARGLSLLLQVGLPSCTWPFCLATLLFLLVTTKNPNIYRMPLSKITYSEENRIFYLQTKKRTMESPLWAQPNPQPWSQVISDYLPQLTSRVSKLLFLPVTNSILTHQWSVFMLILYFSFFLSRISPNKWQTHQGDVLWLWNIKPSWGVGTKTVLYKVRAVQQKEEVRLKLIIDIYWSSWCFS